MKQSILAIALLLLTAAVNRVAIPVAAHAQDKQQKLLEAAKKEGVIDIIATWRPKEAEGIFTAFREAYPAIEVRQTMMAGAVGFERLRAEFASGRRTTDLINTSIIDLKNAGMIQPWPDWYEVFPKTRKDTVHATLSAALEPGGAYGLVYRPDLVPKDLQPLTYDKLSDPRLRGKIGVNIRQYYFWDSLYPKWSEEQILNYVKTVIVPQKPRLYNGSGDGWEMLVRGEVWANPVSNTHQYFSRYLPKGIKNIAVAPDWVGVESGKPIVLLKDAPHPNAAKLFLHWVTTDKAQEVFFKHRGRGNPYDDTNIVGQWFKKHGAKLFEYEDELREAQARESGAKILQMLGVPVPKR
ncbi:MAG TPA: extracellular solute-binding protein [Candidatus Acidoferrales bacterium]|nr:extracellular solute-binding protein [Candidatus Acidoferrales bacterium]